MKEFFEFFQSFGAVAVDTFWFPVIIWSLVAALVFFILKCSQYLNPLYHYHLRLATLFALPLGIISSLIYSQFASLFSVSEKKAGVFLIIENPIPIQSSEFVFQPDWTEANFLIGVLSSILLAISLILLFKLLHNFYQLRSLNSSLKKIDYVDNTNNKIQLAFQEHLFAPFTFGWKKPVIVLPAPMKGDPQKMKIAIDHELIHIKRKDYLLQIGLSIIGSLFWFNPLIQFGNKETEIYREISCDQELLCTTNISPKSYAIILLELAPKHTLTNRFSIYMAQNNSTLKHRIKIMKHHKLKKIPLKRSFSLLLLAVAAITITISCSDLRGSGTTEVQQPESILTTASDLSSNFQDPIDSVFVVVEKVPELIGGFESLLAKLSYPKRALDNKVEGRVVVQFVVDKNGDVQNPKIIRGIGYGCDEEALRVVKKAKFSPGIEHGKPVNVQFSLPIVFRLSDT